MWIEKNQKYCKSFRFSTFSEAMAFVFQVALVAEKLDHHPQWTNNYTEVSFELSTHTAGHIITELDHVLARAIDQIFLKYA